MTTPANIQSLLTRITVNPSVMTGKPTIRGTRLSVEHILKALAADLSYDEILSEYPFLERDDLLACLLYASQTIERERVFAVPA